MTIHLRIATPIIDKEPTKKRDDNLIVATSLINKQDTLFLLILFN